MKALLLILALTFSTQTLAAENEESMMYKTWGNITAKNLYNACGGSATTEDDLDPMLVSYCIGYTQSVIMTIDDMKTIGAVPMDVGFCIPDNAKIQDINGHFLSFIRDNDVPDVLNGRASMALMMSLSRAYACGKIS